MDGGDQSVSMLVTEAQTGGAGQAGGGGAGQAGGGGAGQAGGGGAGQAGGGGDEDRLRRGCRWADQALSSPAQWRWLVSERLETFYKRRTAQFLSARRSCSFPETD